MCDLTALQRYLSRNLENSKSNYKIDSKIVKEIMSSYNLVLTVLVLSSSYKKQK